MIHRVRLAPLIRRCLGDAVALQMSLFAYAAANATVDQAKCAQHLAKDPRFRGRQDAITQWLWRAPKRIALLSAFAAGPQVGKRRLARVARREARRLLRGHTGKLTPWPTPLPAWKDAAASFLLRFYEDLCDPGLPSCIFTSPIASGSFGRQQFFEAFEAVNPGLSICAVCDETSFLTKPSGTSRGDLDHYFPKSYYPHLSCHPFNLVPTCHPCNSYVKGSRDPLDVAGKRYPLNEIFVPYRGDSFKEQAFLKVKLSQLKSSEFEELSPRRNQNLRQAPLSFEATYEVLSRWRARNTTIGESIFRKLKNRIRCITFSSNPTQQLSELVRQLDVLIGELYQELGGEPYLFAMTWWLAKLSKEQLVPAVQGAQSQSPFWAELNGFIETTIANPPPRRISKTERQGQKLRQEVR